MSWRYTDYLAINQDFIDVFTAEQDERNAKAWMSFVPHDQMLDLLESLLDTLERKSPKPLWMHGQYGTGKTMCMFVLKHLLEDPDEVVDEYLRIHNVRRDLCKRIQGIRSRGKGLVVFLSSSGHIDSNLKFMATIERAIQQAVSRVDGQVTGEALFGQVLDRLSSPAINWPALFEAHRAEFFGLADDPNEVIRQLREPDGAAQAKLELLNKVVDCLQWAKIVINDSAEAMKEWLAQIIEANHLDWLVVMWDEFTEFFIHNAGLDGLQELAQFAQKSPFYLLLATHRPPETLERGRRDEWRKIGDRFKTLPYLMEPITATKLMGGVMSVMPGQENDWSIRKQQLWAQVMPFVSGMLDTESGQRTQDYAEIVPLHPYAAFALSRISQNYSSANRTVFRFMKAPEEHGLAQFLQNHPQDDWEWYTADGLWDYFFAESGPDRPDEFRDSIGYYASRKQDVDDPDHLRVFRALMLLIGLERALPGEARVRPTLGNLGLLFAGTPLRNRLEQVTQALAEADLVRPVGVRGSRDGYFTIAQTSIDERRLEQFRKQAPPFSKMCGLGNNSLGQAVQRGFKSFPESLQQRIEYATVSCDDLNHRRERVIPSRLKPYQMATVTVLCESDAEVTEAKRLIQQFVRKAPDSTWILLEEPFGSERYAQYRENWAQHQYYVEVQDARNARFYEQRLGDAIRDWAARFRDARFSLWDDARPIVVSGLVGVRRAAEAALARRFPYRPDVILATDPLFRSSGWGVAGAQVGLGLKARGNPYSQVMDGLRELCPNSEPLQDATLARHPDHVVTKMKQVVDRYLAQDGFGLGELWQVLQSPPFGIPPSPIGITLFGLLLRECGDGYYWIDGTTSHSLDITRLSQLIKDTMDGKADPILQKSSREEQQVCAILAEVYPLGREDTRFLARTRDALRAYFSRVGYPIWSLQYYLSARGLGACDAISWLVDLIVADSIEGFATQDWLKAFLGELHGAKALLKEHNDHARYQKGMLAFLRERDDRVDAVIEQLSMSPSELMLRLADRLQRDVALWQKDQVAERLPALLDELELVGALSALTKADAQDIESATAALRTVLKGTKLPLSVLRYQSDSAVASAIHRVEDVTRLGNAYAEKAPLARLIRVERSGIEQAFASPVSALRLWASDVLNAELSEAEAEELWEQMPDLSDSEEGKLRLIVGQYVREKAKIQEVKLLFEDWERLTGSRNPNHWSESHRIPIRWMVDDARALKSLAVIERPQESTVAAIRQAREDIEELAVALQGTDDHSVEERFKDIVAGAYKPLVRGTAELADLQAFLSQQLGANVSEWNRARARDITIRRIESQYRGKYLPRITAAIENISEEKLRALLDRLVEDPLVGIALLVGVRKNED